MKVLRLWRARNLTSCVLLVLACSLVSAQDSQNAPKSKDDEIAALKQLVQQQAELIAKLTGRVDKLEKDKGITPPPPDEPEIPDVVLPGAEPGKPSKTAQAAAAVVNGPKASFLPDISVIGNNLGRFFTPRGTTDRNRLQLGEFEIGLQQKIYSGVRFDAFLTAGADNGFQVAAEEAYATFSQIGHLPFGAYLGQKRLDFGKINPIHPHARHYADQPAAVANLLGADSLSGNGAALTYLLPVKNLFANLELGFWRTDPSGQGMNIGAGANPPFYPVGAGISGDFPLLRLWLSKELTKAGEIEIGASHGFGKSDLGDRINLTGLDFTYRSSPSAFKRWIFQSEAFWHQRHDAVGGTGVHSRTGHYALLAYQPDQYVEYGLRYDNSQFPWPLPGRDESLSLIWSNNLTETTLLRLQYKYGNRTSSVFLPARNGYNELLLQFIWGGGSHVHSLQ